MPVMEVRPVGAEEHKAQVGYGRVVRNTAHEFWHSTSLAALSHSSRARHAVSRLGWVLLFFAGVYFTTDDVIKVFNSYFSRPYSTQVKSENKALMELPAITVCNQNRISCYKLLDAMLHKLDENDDQGYKMLEDLYLLSQCGPKSLKCHTVLQNYQDHFGDNKTIPESLFVGDTCLDCETILKLWVEHCEDEDEQPYQSYDFWWRKLECTKTLSDSLDETLDILKPLQISEVPDSLETCPRRQGKDDPPLEDADGNSTTSSPTQTPSSQNSSEPSTNESIDSEGGSLDGPVSNSSTTELDAAGNGSENSSQTNTTESQDAQEQVTSDSTTDTRTKPDSTTANRRRKRSVDEGPMDFILYQDNRMEKSQQYDNQMKFLTTYMLLPDSLKRDLGYTFDDFILSCKFMGYNCTNSSLFMDYYSPTYGNCYIFNYEGDNTLKLPGPTYSLFLVLHVHQDTYLPELLTDRLGARLTLHPPYTEPALEDEGTDVSPGMASSVAVRKVEYKRLQTPYRSNCTTYWNNTNYSPYSRGSDHHHHRIYSFSTCLKMCAQRMFMDNCNCTHPLLPISFIHAGKVYDQKRICNLTSGNEDNTCHDTFLSSKSSYLEDPSECDCTLACSEVTYPTVVSSTTWPPEASKLSVHVTYNMENAKVTKNLVVVQVFFQSFIADTIEEIKQYTGTNDLVSSLGGALSLYLGMSLFLLVEVLEFLLSLIYNSILYLIGRYSSPRDEEQKQEPAKTSISPSGPLKTSTDIHITTTTPADGLGYLRGALDLDRLLEALTKTDTSSSLRTYNSRVFDGVFHQ